jgi:hypothetical protein
MKRFFKWLFWLVAAAAVVVGTWFAFDGRTNDVVEAPVVETADTTAVKAEANLEVVDTLNTINTVKTNE